MEKFQPKLFSSETANAAHPVYPKRVLTNTSARKYAKAIIFKDCEPDLKTYQKISKILKNNQSFKISYFKLDQLEEKKTKQHVSVNKKIITNEVSVNKSSNQSFSTTPTKSLTIQQIKVISPKPKLSRIPKRLATSINSFTLNFDDTKIETKKINYVKNNNS